MKLIDINDNMVSADVNATHFPLREVSRSGIQNQVGKILKSRFNLYTILEEWTIPSSRLSLDFFIPQRLIAIEVQGEQHKKYSKFFHGSREAFMQQLNRDKTKADWCEKNDIYLISGYTIEEIEEAIKNA